MCSQEKGEAMVQDLLQTSPLGLRLTKQGLNMSIDAGSLEAATTMEDRQQAIMLMSPDFTEGVRAFIEVSAGRKD